MVIVIVIIVAMITVIIMIITDNELIAYTITLVTVQTVKTTVVCTWNKT